MRITERGQITIPIALRRKYGIGPNDQVTVVDGDGGLRIVVERTADSPGARMVRRMRGRGNFGMSTDEYMRLIRSDDTER